MPADQRYDLEAHLRRQSAACGDLGSSLYGSLLAFAADDYAAGGPVADVLADWELEPGRSALALRLCGTVHRLALTGAAPELARFYLSVAGEDVEPYEPGQAWVAFRDVLAGRADEVRAGLASPPQTNEIGRSAALLGGLLILRQRVDLPVRLIEIGASAGLNLRPDLIRIELADWRSIGPVASPVVLSDPWHGAVPPLTSPVEIVERAGSDTDPVDVTSAAGRLRLTSYVWPDQGARLSRLRGAFDLASASPVEIVREPAATTVAALKPTEGAVTVVWHSVMWQYLDAEEQAELGAAFDAVGALATQAAPFARLELEPRQRAFPFPSGIEFEVRLRTWPTGEENLLAFSHPHGESITWHRL